MEAGRTRGVIILMRDAEVGEKDEKERDRILSFKREPAHHGMVRKS